MDNYHEIKIVVVENIDGKLRKVEEECECYSGFSFCEEELVHNLILDYFVDILSGKEAEGFSVGYAFRCPTVTLFVTREDAAYLKAHVHDAITTILIKRIQK